MTLNEYLLERFNNKDEEAFEELYNENYAVLLKCAYNILKDEEKAKDIVTDSFVEVWKKGVPCKTRKDFKWYMYGTVRNRSFNSWNEHKKENNVYTDLSHLSTAKKVEKHELAEATEVVWQDYVEKIKAAVEKLPRKMRIVFKLHYYEQLPIEAIALQLNKTTSTVYHQLATAREKIRKTLPNLDFNDPI